MGAPAGGGDAAGVLMVGLVRPVARRARVPELARHDQPHVPAWRLPLAYRTPPPPFFFLITQNSYQNAVSSFVLMSGRQVHEARFGRMQVGPTKKELRLRKKLRDGSNDWRSSCLRCEHTRTQFVYPQCLAEYFLSVSHSHDTRHDTHHTHTHTHNTNNDTRQGC